MSRFENSFDIAEFIASLPEPQRSFCHAMILNGESSAEVAFRFRVCPKTVLRKTRKALAPLAVQFHITAAEKFLHAEKHSCKTTRNTSKPQFPEKTLQVKKGSSGNRPPNRLLGK